MAPVYRYWAENCRISGLEYQQHIQRQSDGTGLVIEQSAGQVERLDKQRAGPGQSADLLQCGKCLVHAIAQQETGLQDQIKERDCEDRPQIDLYQRAVDKHSENQGGCDAGKDGGGVIFPRKAENDDFYTLPCHHQCRKKSTAFWAVL